MPYVGQPGLWDFTTGCRPKEIKLNSTKAKSSITVYTCSARRTSDYRSLKQHSYEMRLGNHTRKCDESDSSVQPDRPDNY